MSAFEFYQRKKKKPKLFLGKDDKAAAESSSQPSSIFGDIAVAPCPGNVFLNDASSGREGTKKKLKKRKKKIEEEVPAKKLKKRKFVGQAITLNGSTDTDDPIIDFVKVKKKPAFESNSQAQDSEEVFNKGVFLETKIRPQGANVLKKKKIFQDVEILKEVSKVKSFKKIKPKTLVSEYLVDEENEKVSQKEPLKKTKKKRKKGLFGSEALQESEDFNNQRKKTKEQKLKVKPECSVKKGREMLGWIISPISVDKFFDSYWEKKPLYVARNNLEYFDGICSTDDLDLVFRKCQINLIKNVTVTSYENGERTTETTPGRARPNAVWDMFEQGHSIRLLNPQTFVPNIGTIVATLQEYFRCMVGVNSYLTPAGTQGFAPHYDDIEAFILQLEGKKEWKVYPPRSEGETLPRHSSPDFQQDEIGKPIMVVTLQAGDLLYLPRGWIHQARSLEDHHSLHITVSTYQCNSWGDFFRLALPFAVENAIAEDVEMRAGLPLDFIDHLGAFNANENSPNRNQILQKATQLFSKIVNHCPWDEVADQMGKDFIHSSFPPPNEDLSPLKWEKISKEPLTASVRLITANVCRICSEEDGKLVCYYSTDNGLEPKGEELLGFEVSPEEVEVMQKLRVNYPDFTRCSSLISETFAEENLTELLTTLAQRALIRVK